MFRFIFWESGCFILGNCIVAAWHFLLPSVHHAKTHSRQVKDSFQITRFITGMCKTTAYSHQNEIQTRPNKKPDTQFTFLALVLNIQRLFCCCSIAAQCKRDVQYRQRCFRFFFPYGVLRRCCVTPETQPMFTSIHCKARRLHGFKTKSTVYFTNPFCVRRLM